MTSLQKKFEQKSTILESDQDLFNMILAFEEYFQQDFSASEILSSGILKVIKTLNKVFQEKTKT